VTIAIRPLCGWDGEGSSFDLGQAETEIFLKMGLDRQISDLPDRQVSRTDQYAGWVEPFAKTITSVKCALR
jgi:hypothetical protein